jgi:hypothetical protein
MQRVKGFEPSAEHSLGARNQSVPQEDVHRVKKKDNASADLKGLNDYFNAVKARVA